MQQANYWHLRRQKMTFFSNIWEKSNASGNELPKQINKNRGFQVFLQCTEPHSNQPFSTLSHCKTKMIAKQAFPGANTFPGICIWELWKHSQCPGQYLKQASRHFLNTELQITEKYTESVKLTLTLTNADNIYWLCKMSFTKTSLQAFCLEYQDSILMLVETRFVPHSSISQNQPNTYLQGYSWIYNCISTVKGLWDSKLIHTVFRNAYYNCS
jgi:hypothetical protein